MLTTLPTLHAQTKSAYLHFYLLFSFLYHANYSSHQRWAVPFRLPYLRTANMYAFVVPVRCTEYGTSLEYIVRTSIVRNIYLSPYIDLPYNKILCNDTIRSVSRREFQA